MNKDVLTQNALVKIGYRQSGLTLIELMLSIAIMTIISALAVPAFSGLIEKHKIQTQVSEIYRLLVFARTESVNLNSPVTICSSIDNHTCSSGRNWSGRNLLVYADKNFNFEIDSDERIIKVFTVLDPESRIFWRSFRNRSALTFMPTGITNYQSGNITYCPPSLDLEQSKILVMNMAGRPYYGKDSNGDNIDENGSGENLSCSI